MKNTPVDRFIKIGNRQFHYLDWDAGGEGAVMLLLHGIGDDAHVWDHFAGYASRSRRIIALDQRGHGKSDWAAPPAYRGDDYVADLDGLVNALQLTNIVLMGHSMGALHATRYAALRPEKAAALIHADIEPCPPEWNKKYLTNLYERLPFDYASIDEYVEEMRKNSPYADDETLFRIAAFALAAGMGGRLRVRYDREVLAHFDRYDLRSCLGQIRCPALIVRGAESRVMSAAAAREMCGAIPRGEFTEIPMAAHPVHTDNPEGFARAVLAFLNEIYPASCRRSANFI